MRLNIKEKIKKIALIIAVIAVSGCMCAGIANNTYADDPECETSILPEEWCGEDGTEQIVRFILSIFTGMAVVAGTIGIVICGIMWMTAQGNEAQVVKAKKRMLEIVIGLIMWAVCALLYNLLVPNTSNPMPTAKTQEQVLVANVEEK